MSETNPEYPDESTDESEDGIVARVKNYIGLE